MGLCGRPSLDLESMEHLWMKSLSLDMIDGEDSSELQRGCIPAIIRPFLTTCLVGALKAEERLMDFPLG